jgi:malate synthase
MSGGADVAGLEVTGPTGDRYAEVLTPEALELVAPLHRELTLPAHERMP